MFCTSKIDNASNVGIGNDPLRNTKLRLYETTSLIDTLYGLHTTLENTATSSSGQYFGKSPLYGIFSSNTNYTCSPLHGAYLKNTQVWAT
jgi:hypothetical protein